MAVQGVGHQAVGQGIVVGVARRGLTRDHRVLGAGRRTVGGHRRMIHRCDGQVDGGRIGIDLPVIGLEGEEVRSDVAGVGGVGPASTGAHHHMTVQGVCHQGVGQGVAVHVAGRGRAVQHGVLVPAARSIGGHRSIVHGGDGEADRGGGRERRPVAGLVGETVAAVVVGDGRVDEAAIGREAQASVARA